MAGLYNGYLLEFPLIRVDCFTALPPTHRPPWLLPHPRNPNIAPRRAPHAQLFLLTHVHADHLSGLTNDFTGRIVCSPDTKRMLVRLEAENDRKHFHHGVSEVGRRKYDGLRPRVTKVGNKESVIDLIDTLEYGETRRYDLGYFEGRPMHVAITLLEANHCPGSSMFLIVSPDAAVLHTGDIRADKTFMRSLRRVSPLQEFIIPWSSNGFSANNASPRRTLDRIYLDTSAFIGTGDMPEKETVLQDLVEQMSLYPPDTIFFLDVWCFGWEDVVKEVARHFDSLVHVDRYKRSIYRAVQSDPFLSNCTTDNHSSTRFHACERRFRCETCTDSDKEKLVVQVHMVEIKSAQWDAHHRDSVTALSNAALGDGPWPRTIDVPFARHSPLPELQDIVGLFRPASLSPNCLTPGLRGLDFFFMPDLFQKCLSDEAAKCLIAERDAWFAQCPRFGPLFIPQMKAQLRTEAGHLFVRTNIARALDDRHGTDTSTSAGPSTHRPYALTFPERPPQQTASPSASKPEPWADAKDFELVPESPETVKREPVNSLSQDGQKNSSSNPASVVPDTTPVSSSVNADTTPASSNLASPSANAHSTPASSNHNAHTADASSSVKTHTTSASSTASPHALTSSPCPPFGAHGPQHPQYPQHHNGSSHTVPNNSDIEDVLKSNVLPTDDDPVVPAEGPRTNSRKRTNQDDSEDVKPPIDPQNEDTLDPKNEDTLDPKEESQGTRKRRRQSSLFRVDIAHLRTLTTTWTPSQES